VAGDAEDILKEWAESRGGGDVTAASARDPEDDVKGTEGKSPEDLKELGRQLVLGLLARELHALRGSLQALPPSSQPAPAAAPAPAPAPAAKRYRPQGYFGSRGKRFMPGMASLILAKYYRDAKWKRQPHFGFHGSRG